MKIKITVDREEEGTLIFVDKNEKTYEIKKEDAPENIREGDICEAEISSAGEILHLSKDVKKTDKKKTKMKKRLSGLFSNKKR